MHATRPRRHVAREELCGCWVQVLGGHASLSRLRLLADARRGCLAGTGCTDALQVSGARCLISTTTRAPEAV